MGPGFRIVAIGIMLSGLCAGLGPPASGQTLDQVVQKYLAARGVEKWRQVQSMKVTAAIDSQGHSTQMTVTSKRPNLVRQELTMDGVTRVEAYDGKSVWGINPDVSPDPQVITGPQATALADQADFDLVLFDYKQKGYDAELAGTSKVGGHEAYDVRIARSHGVVQDYFIDQTTFLEDRVATQISRGGQTLNSTSDPSDFRSVEGVMMPFTITNQVSGGPVVTLHVQTIEFNVSAGADLFRMPKKGGAPPDGQETDGTAAPVMAAMRSSAIKGR